VRRSRRTAYDARKSIRVGDPAQRDAHMGRVISEKQMQSILGYIHFSKQEGTSLVTGGQRTSARLFHRTYRIRQCRA
jgi:aldehyde dehydrogenase (NAD+)